MMLPYQIDIGREDDPFQSRRWDDVVIAWIDNDDRDWKAWRFELEVRSFKGSGATMEEIAGAIGARHNLAYVPQFIGMEHRWLKPN